MILFVLIMQNEWVDVDVLYVLYATNQTRCPEIIQTPIHNISRKNDLFDKLRRIYPS